MKYVFTTLLVVPALILVFHCERILAMPRTLDAVTSSRLGAPLPFDFKVAYAESGIEGIQKQREREPYAASKFAGRVPELDRQVESWQKQPGGSVARLRALANNSPQMSADAIEREVRRHDDLQGSRTQAANVQAHATQAMNGGFSRASAPVAIQVSPKASSPERVAAKELAGYLKQIYPRTEFAVVTNADAKAGMAIQLGTPDSAPELLKFMGERKMHGPESYVVTQAIIDGHETGIIFGADPAGVIYGVYGLLEKLGCGFFISFDTVPKPSQEAFSFEQWNVANHPLTPLRQVFEWHNFLTGCSAWDLEQWKSWVAQAQKSGFNTVMVHCYGNNPSFSFEFNGVTKEAGYLANTRTGRDFGVNHINDIRRGYGGFLFNDAIFGSKAAKVPDDPRQRTASAQALMREVFEYAQERGMKINFALDVDTESANPQDVIMTLSQQDRFKINGMWAVRPDTPGGYQYYKAQAKALLDSYPQIATVSLWRRRAAGMGAKWVGIKLEDMPASWQAEYNAHIAAHPQAAIVDLSVFNFAIAKVFKAWRTALDELGRKEIPIATGSWGFEWLDGAVEFLPEDIQLQPLDYWSKRPGGGELNNPASLSRLAKTVQPGRLIPVIWAQHDDGAYIGAPLGIIEKFNDKLKTCGAGGFAVIHWMTHPLDPFFASHIRQTWAQTENEAAEQTGRFVADHWFGEANGQLLGGYLQQWMTEMPAFGRETSERFFDRAASQYGGADKTIAGCTARIGLLNKADTASMTAQEKKQLEFFKQYEQFVADLFRVQDQFDRAKKAIAGQNLGAARAQLTHYDPGAVVERYAKLIQERGPTRGEEGLVVTMNTRWIPWHIQLRQQTGLEAVRHNYAATSHERLAQSAGASTFHVTPDNAWWLTLGEKEVRAGKVFAIPENTRIDMSNSGGAFAGYEEVFRTGMESDQTINLKLAPILPPNSKDGEKPASLPPGRYTLTLMFVEPEATAPEHRVMEIQISGMQQKTRVDIFKQAGGKNRALTVEFPIKLAEAGTAEANLTPVKGRALICGFVLNPVGLEPEKSKR